MLYHQVKLMNEFVADHDLSIAVNYEQQFSPHVIIERGNSAKSKQHIHLGYEKLNNPETACPIVTNF